MLKSKFELDQLPKHLLLDSEQSLQRGYIDNRVHVPFLWTFFNIAVISKAEVSSSDITAEILFVT